MNNNNNSNKKREKRWGGGGGHTIPALSTLTICVNSLKCLQITVKLALKVYHLYSSKFLYSPAPSLDL